MSAIDLHKWIFVFGEVSYRFANDSDFAAEFRKDPQGQMAKCGDVCLEDLPEYVTKQLNKIDWSMSDERLVELSKVRADAW